ncbi:hypothetical protein B0H13DRAFT_1853456 [Mycena leptocephala]|nr:hypothetical protein B0H13DRAFT_1853456 [Mycena leptocephala]
MSLSSMFIATSDPPPTEIEYLSQSVDELARLSPFAGYAHARPSVDPCLAGGTEIILDEYREYDYSEYGGVGPAFRNGDGDVYLQLQHWGGDLHTTQLSDYCPSEYGHPDPIQAQRDFQLSDNWNSLHPTFKTTQPRKKDKQLMACLSCRERKIGCVRPKNSPDQTCNALAGKENVNTRRRRDEATTPKLVSGPKERARRARRARRPCSEVNAAKHAWGKLDEDVMEKRRIPAWDEVNTDNIENGRDYVYRRSPDLCCSGEVRSISFQTRSQIYKRKFVYTLLEEPPGRKFSNGCSPSRQRRRPYIFGNETAAARYKDGRLPENFDLETVRYRRPGSFPGPYFNCFCQYGGHSGYKDDCRAEKCEVGYLKLLCLSWGAAGRQKWSNTVQQDGKHLLNMGQENGIIKLSPAEIGAGGRWLSL